VEALIAAAPAAAWPANTLSPSRLPSPTIARRPGRLSLPGNGEKRRRGGLGDDWFEKGRG
jgi:hypothetical protein